jgi:hypothetical protein
MAWTESVLWSSSARRRRPEELIKEPEEEEEGPAESPRPERVGFGTVPWNMSFR